MTNLRIAALAAEHMEKCKETTLNAWAGQDTHGFEALSMRYLEQDNTLERIKGAEITAGPKYKSLWRELHQGIVIGFVQTWIEDNEWYIRTLAELNTLSTTIERLQHQNWTIGNAYEKKQAIYQSLPHLPIFYCSRCAFELEIEEVYFAHLKCPHCNSCNHLNFHEESEVKL